MPTSAPGSSKPRRSAGFTLVELMVVLVVIGLAAGVAVLAMPDPASRLRDEAARFGLRVRAAHDLAIVAGRPVSVWVTPGGYGFDERRGGAWVPMSEAPLRVDRWRDGTSARVAANARVTFDATGMADRPVVVPLARGRARATVRVDADGGVRVEG